MAQNKIDTRYVYSVGCTWFGSIYEVGETTHGHIPCCPHCGSVLFELSDEKKWWKGVDGYDELHPNYRKMLEWQKDQKICFKTMKDLNDAFKGATGLEVSL